MPKNDTRGAFPAGRATAVTTAPPGSEYAAQSGLTINDPNVVREVAAEFTRYDQALASNNVEALNGFFFNSPLTVRYGNAENLYGFQEIAAYRSGVSSRTAPKRERTVITSYGNDYATVSTLSRSRPGKIGRTMQTWVRFPIGWRIVGAHVSAIDEPPHK
jgi:hypothetical protein